MVIKTIIFDLDDTLYNQEQIRDTAREQSVEDMMEKGLNCSVEAGCRKLKEITERTHVIERYKELIRYFGCYDDAIAEVGKQKYINADFDELEVYPGTKEVLEKLKKEGFKLILVTEGSFSQQNKKIDVLGVRGYFDKTYISEGDKFEYFKNILETNSLNIDEVVVVGDRIDREISVGNKLSIKTIRLLKGVYSSRTPETDLEKPDFEINSLLEIPEIINKVNNKALEKVDEINNISNLYRMRESSLDSKSSHILNKFEDTKKLAKCLDEVGHEARSNGIKIIAIGGGTGLPTIAEGLRKYTDDLTLIVTVTDSGRSSGMLRKELNVLPPGDLRNNLIALSNSEKLMCDLFQYRFDNGSLEGHNFGNLLIAALTKLTGSFEKAIEEASKILKLKGKVLPSTFDNIHICAELEDGNVLEQEDNIIDRHNDYVHLRPKIKRVFLKPKAKANPLALKEIKNADLIILCPGSLFTSVITNLLVEEIADAINRSNAKKVYVCNIMTQVSQTHGFKASDHLKNILNYLNGNIDFVILNNLKPSFELLESYKKENAFLVENDIEEIHKLGIRVVKSELLDRVAEKKMLWEKKDLLRHDPNKVAEVIIGLVRNE